jgi:hypothetical protein
VYCSTGVPSRAVTARLAVLLLVWAQLALPAAALAQGSPFAPIPQAPPQQTAPPEDVEDDDGDEGLSETQQLLIAVAGIALLGGIAWAIVRDARRAAPVEARSPATDSGERTKGSRTPPKRRVEQNRARAKTARQARKRNR